MSRSGLACYDRFRTKPIDRGATFTEVVTGTCQNMRWRRELADVVAREQQRAKSFDANGVRERLARAGLHTGGEDFRRRLATYMAAEALRRVAINEIVAGDKQQQVRTAQADSDPVQAFTELILWHREAEVEARDAAKAEAAKESASAARRAGLIDTVAPIHTTSRPSTADGLDTRSNPIARQTSQRRRRRKPLPAFDIRAVAARPWTGHERGEHLPLGHKNMKNGGYQDRTRPYIRPSEQQTSRSTSADTQARLTAHCNVLQMYRTKELQRSGYRRAKDFSRPTTPEFWYRQSLDGSRIDVSTDGVYTADGLSGGQGPHRCLVRTREVHAGGKVMGRLDDSINGTCVCLPGPEEQSLQAPEGFSFPTVGDEAARRAMTNVSRPSTADAPIPKAAVRRLGRFECGLDEGSDSWLVGQVSSERHFDFVRALKRGERIS